MNEGIISHYEFNNVIFPQINKRYIDITDKYPSNYMVYGQLFGSYILDTQTNEKFRITSWVDKSVHILKIKN